MNDRLSPLGPIRTAEDLNSLEQSSSLGRDLPSSIFEMLENSRNRYGERVALAMVRTGAPDEQVEYLTYAELHARVCRTANLLASIARQGCGVAYMLPSLPETQVLLWAAETVGYAVPLNPMLQNDQLVELIKASGAAVLATCGPSISPQVWEKIRSIRKALPELRILCIRPPEGCELDALIVDFDGAASLENPLLLNFQIDLDPGRVVAYFHTGGTTGVPKLVGHTAKNQLFAALGAAVLLDLSCEDAVTNGMPLFHVGGAIASSLAFFMVGAKVVTLSPTGLRNPDMVQNFWRIVESQNVTVAGAVPTALSAILTRPVDANLGKVRFGITGSAPTPKSLTEKFLLMTGRELHEILGMTESAGVTAVDPGADAATTSSVGLRLPYTSLEVRERLADGGLGSRCKDFEVGMLVVSGPTVSPGYRDKRHNAGVFVDGKLISGDLGYFDERGKLFIAGRAKDVIIRSGHNIDPTMIEAAFTAHPAVAMAAAVGQPDPYAGELPACYVTLVPGSNATPDELAEFARDRIDERPAWPKSVFIVPALPLTSIGKVFKPALRADATVRVLEPLLRGAIGDALVGIEAVEGGRRGVRIEARVNSPEQTVYNSVRRVLSGFVFDYNIQVVDETVPQPR